MLEGRVEIIQTKEWEGKLIPGRGNSRSWDAKRNPILGRANCLTRVESEYPEEGGK